jgi:hypothetical protein
MPKADWGSGASGAASGAATGFSVGGPAGAVVGGVAGLFGGLWGGNKKKKKKKLSTLDKNQQGLHDEQYQAFHGEGPLADLYNYDPEKANAVFDQNIGNPAYRNFSEQIVPKITGAYRSQGLMNSSYSGDALSKAGRDVQENLNAKRSEYMYNQENQAKQNKINSLENYQNRQTFAYDDSPNQGGGNWMDNILNSISPGGLSKFTEDASDIALKYLPGGFH